jgi:4-diphosphocytidyl-2-C-methyl-D-erythritol kinase
MPERAVTAPAKINLTLEIRGRRADGYHQLESLVAFAIDAADDVSLRPGPGFSLTVEGSEAGELSGENLIARVAHAIGDARPDLTIGAFRLTKRLPVASGIGGGSADAAAAIRLIAAVNDIADPHAEFARLAATLGADIPVCIGGGGRKAAFMWGSGDEVWRPGGARLLPAGGLAAVLVNPRVAVSTAAVFKALGAGPLEEGESAALELPPPLDDLDAVLAYVGDRTNDLEAPAIGIAPVIAEVLETLSGLAGARLARMSGSGATCFALFDNLETAIAGASYLRTKCPGWWAAATRLC